MRDRLAWTRRRTEQDAGVQPAATQHCSRKYAAFARRRFRREHHELKPYALPGQNEDPSQNPCNGQVEYVPGDPFALSYANSNQRVQSSDWWSSMAFQLQGWVNARGGIVNCVDTGDPLANSLTFASEPFQFQFLDFNTKLFGTFPPEAGLTLWNQDNFQVANNAKVYDYPKIGTAELSGLQYQFRSGGLGQCRARHAGPRHRWTRRRASAA